MKIKQPKKKATFNTGKKPPERFWLFFFGDERGMGIYNLRKPLCSSVYDSTLGEWSRSDDSWVSQTKDHYDFFYMMARPTLEDVLTDLTEDQPTWI